MLRNVRGEGGVRPWHCKASTYNGFVSGGTAYCVRGIFSFLKLSEVLTHLQFTDRLTTAKLKSQLPEMQ